MRSTAEFNILAKKYMDSIFRLAFSYLKSHTDADDVTQNVLLSLYRSDHTFDSDEHLKNWLFKCTLNECRKIWRRPFRNHENIEDYAERLYFEEKSHQDLFAAILKLDKARRLTIVLHYIEGYSIREIAEIMAIPPGTVGTRLASARAKLKQYLKEEESI